MKEPQVPTDAEVQRHIRELEKKMGIKRRKRLEAADELGPPDTGANLTDFRLARARRRRPPQATA